MVKGLLEELGIRGIPTEELSDEEPPRSVDKALLRQLHTTGIEDDMLHWEISSLVLRYRAWAEAEKEVLYELLREEGDGEETGGFTINFNLLDVVEQPEAKARAAADRLVAQFGERIEVTADSHHLLIRANESLRVEINVILAAEGLPTIDSLDDDDEPPAAHPEE